MQYVLTATALQWSTAVSLQNVGFMHAEGQHPCMLKGTAASRPFRAEQCDRTKVLTGEATGGRELHTHSSQDVRVYELPVVAFCNSNVTALP
jgi:hypothetical protein